MSKVTLKCVVGFGGEPMEEEFPSMIEAMKFFNSEIGTDFPAAIFDGEELRFCNAAWDEWQRRKSARG